MEGPAANLPSASGSQVETQKKEDVATKRARTRNKEKQPGNPSKKIKDKERRKKRNQRRKKTISHTGGDADVQSENTETAQMDVVEAASSQTQASVSMETQHVEPQAEDSTQTVENRGEQRCKDAKMVQAQTQTRKQKGTDKFTQTPVVLQSSQETQTDFPEPKQDDAEEEKARPHPGSQQDKRAPEPRPQDDSAAQAPPRPTGNPDKDKAPSDPAEEQNPEKESECKEETPAAGPSAAPADSQDRKGAEPKSYAKAVCGDGADKKSSVGASKAADKTTRTSQSARDRSPVRPPPAAPMFTVHIYAVLDKKFRFNQKHDTLLLCYEGGYLPFQLTHFVGLKNGGYLVEASLSIEERDLCRGDRWTYWYGVKQRQKEISGSVTRIVQIPFDSNIKELHLYEGFIARQDVPGLWQTGLKMVGLNRSKGVEMSDAWQASARDLLNRIFQKWIPSDKQSTESLCDNLKHFSTSLDSAYERMEFLDSSRPPVVKTSELISETLVQILKGESKEKFPGSWSSTSPLILGLSVFMVTMNCSINLGVKGWAELCVLVSSEAAMDEKNLDGLLTSFQNPQFTVLALINHCALQTVSELVLLVPLLHRLRQPGADAAKVGPVTQEENWSGLDHVRFSRFRENLQPYPDKRKRMLTLIQSRLPMAKEKPLLLMSWLSLVAFEDLPEFSELTGIPAEHLIQSLFYRLRTCGEPRDNNRAQENVKITQKALTHILLKVDEEKDRLIESGNIEPAFMSSISVLKSTCGLVRLVPGYQAAVLSYQLVLKLAELLDAKLRKESSENEFEALKRKLLDKLHAVQQLISEWRDDLLQKPLLAVSKSLSYPKEIEMWDALLKVECSLEDVSSCWRLSLTKDLKKRISKASEEDKVLVCCLESPLAAIKKSHDAVQTCFHELCQSAIKTICQSEKEGDLMQTLSSKVKDLPDVVTSAVVVESAARFRDNAVVQLLDPQSAMNHLLSYSDWKSIHVDDAAGHVVHSCLTELQTLVESLLQGHVPLGHLQTCLRYKEQFKRLHQQYKKNTKSKAVPVEALTVLAQREKDLSSFMLRKEQMDTLIKMIGKVTESITVPEMSTLEEQHSADLHAVSLNKLVLVQVFDAEGKVGKTGPPQVLWYKTSLNVLKMASEMHKLHHSNLILSFWVKEAASLASARRPCPAPVPITLTQICENIWKPLLAEFCQLGISIANANITFRQLDQVLVESGDQEDGKIMKKELSLMSETFGEFKPEQNWVELRLGLRGRHAPGEEARGRCGGCGGSASREEEQGRGAEDPETCRVSLK